MSTNEIIAQPNNDAEGEDRTARLRAAEDHRTPIHFLKQLYLSGDADLINTVRGNQKWQLFRTTLITDNSIALGSKPHEYVDDLLARLLS